MRPLGPLEQPQLTVATPQTNTLPTDIEAIFSEKLRKDITVGQTDLISSMKVICEQIQYSAFLKDRAFLLFGSSTLKDFAKKLLSRALDYRNQKAYIYATTEDLARYKLKGKTVQEKRLAYSEHVFEVVKSYNAEIENAESDMRVLDLLFLSVIKQLSSLYLGNSVYLVGRWLVEGAPYTFTNHKSTVPTVYPILYLAKQHAHGSLAGNVQGDLAYQFFSGLSHKSKAERMSITIDALQAIFGKQRLEFHIVSAFVTTFNIATLLVQ